MRDINSITVIIIIIIINTYIYIYIYIYTDLPGSRRSGDLPHHLGCHPFEHESQLGSDPQNFQILGIHQRGVQSEGGAVDGGSII